MPDLQPSKFKIGDRVILKTQAGRIGKVVDLRGLFGTAREPIYRVLIRRKPRPGYVEVLESQMEPAPAKSDD